MSDNAADWQSWAALAVVAITTAAFVWRSVRRMQGKKKAGGGGGACGSGCGCGVKGGGLKAKN